MRLSKYLDKFVQVSAKDVPIYTKKTMSATANKLRFWMQEKMVKSQREELMRKMEVDWKISERTLIHDLNHGNTPPWRRVLWRKEIENTVAYKVEEVDVFPEPYKNDQNMSSSISVKVKEKVK